MTFDEAIEAADVHRPDVKAFRKDVHAAWLAVGADRTLEVGVVRAVLRGVLTAEQVLAAHALGGDAAVRGLVEGAGCATWA
jgi:hypothetical protein